MAKKQDIGKDMSPIGYVGKRGLAFIEVLALLDEIQDWLSKGYTMVSIYKMYVDAGKISTLYKFGSFRRAVLKAMSARESTSEVVVSKRFAQNGKCKRLVKPENGKQNELFPMPEGDFIND